MTDTFDENIRRIRELIRKIDANIERGRETRRSIDATLERLKKRLEDAAHENR